MTTDINYGFDASFYRSVHSDLAHMDDAAALSHYLLHGIDEGRKGNPLGDRPGFLADLSRAGSVLEIGPFCNPLLCGPDVRYLDMLDASQLHQRAIELGLDPSGCPAEIHFVGDMDTVTGTFDTVVSSHSIEHQPDLVAHLRGVARVLEAGGRYCLFVPDKRYCFDHHVPESSIADVMQAYVDRPKVHALRSIIEHWCLNVHNDPVRHWAGDHDEVRAANQDQRIDEAVAAWQASNGAYIDVHAWYFTPQNFWNIMSSLNARGLTALRPVVVFPTIRDTLEFFAILERV